MAQNEPFANCHNLKKSWFPSIFSTMGRSYRRKTAKVSEKAMADALEAVKKGQHVRTAARYYNVPRGTLQHRVKLADKPKRSIQVQISNHSFGYVHTDCEIFISYLYFR